MRRLHATTRCRNCIVSGHRSPSTNFGTEYSSFEYLRAYDVSHLKIAQSFIDDIDSDPERAATIRAIISIARELHIGVIAEGIETEEQRGLLAATGSTAHARHVATLNGRVKGTS